MPHGHGARKQEEELDRVAAFLSFLFTDVLAFRTYVCRGSYVPSSASKRAAFLLGLPLIYWRRDGIIGIIRFTTDRRDASRDTLSVRGAPHAHGARYEERRERESGCDTAEDWTTSYGCCARDYVALAAALVLRDAER